MPAVYTRRAGLKRSRPFLTPFTLCRPLAVPVGRNLVALRPALLERRQDSCLALMGSALPSRKPLVGEPGGLRYARAEL